MTPATSFRATLPALPLTCHSAKVHTTAQERVRIRLHGPRGDLNGVLLDDGSIIRLPPPEARRLDPLLRANQAIAAQGWGLAGPAGRVLRAARFEPDPATLTALPPAPPRPPR